MCVFDAEIYEEDTLEYAIDSFICCNNIATNRKEPEHSLLQLLFNWIPISLIKKTFQLSTQHTHTPASSLLRMTYRSPFPAFDAKRRSEPVATDTVYSDTPAIDDGSTCAQLFVGTTTLVTDVYGMKTDKQFINILEDNIRKRGAMDKLISDSSQSEISNRVKDILRALFIDDWQSEPHCQHQNFAERRYQTVKRQTNTLLENVR